MTSWLFFIDRWLFHWVNHSWTNPVFDRVMPLLSGNAWFVPAVVLAVVALLWRGGLRGRLCVALLALAIAATDGGACKHLKSGLGRPRPFNAVPSLPDTTVRVGRSDSGSMPSSHAANWFAAAVVLGTYYRRSVRWTLPLALAVSFSRVYNGVHYPSDVLVGMLLGAGIGWAILQCAERGWRFLGARWFPLWWSRLPSVLDPDRSVPGAPGADGLTPGVRAWQSERHWLRLGYLVLGVILISRWLYLAGDRIELSEDEAYQWTWSKHLALSYFSKPPLIAYVQFLGTSLWGDTAFGVRFFAPLIAATLGWLLLHFFAREIDARTGFLLMIITNAAPLMTAGSALMTIDPLSVLFWVAAMLAGWRAIHDNRLGQWGLTGLWMGLGFLSKPVSLFQLLSWALLFALWPTARARLLSKGPWIALGINLVCTLPVLVWNVQHDWVTVAHIASNGGLHEAWRPTLRYLADFTGAELGLLNPVFFVAALWAAVGFWRMKERRPLMLFLFCMGAPLFLFYWLYTLRYRVLPNWIAPSALPLFALMTAYWELRWRQGAKRVGAFLLSGLILGAVVTVIMLFPETLSKAAGRQLSARLDPLRRIRAWSDTARLIADARRQLLAEGKPVFIIADHYGITGQFSFYIPEAKAAVTRVPLVYFRSSDAPENQYFFWPGYSERKGQNAIFVAYTDTPLAPPPRLVAEFSSVTDLGVKDVLRRGVVYRRMQLFECRGLR